MARKAGKKKTTGEQRPERTVRPGVAASTLTDLAPAEINPRTAWKPEQVDSFKASLREFGDLSGITRNRRTGRLIGGHKRVEAFETADPKPKIVLVPVEGGKDASGTVATGYVVVEGTRFAYREVDWDSKKEKAANLAANQWGAEFDWPSVSAILQELGDSELVGLTGFPAHELENLRAADWTPPAAGKLGGEKDKAGEGDEKGFQTVQMSQEAYAILQQAKTRIKEQEGGDAPLSDGRVIELVCADFLSGT